MRIPITKEELDLAAKHVWKEGMEEWNNCRNGNLGEILFCKWVGQTWVPRGRQDTGIDVYWAKENLKVQVKTVRDEPTHRRMWLESGSKDANFDVYCLVLLSQDLTYAEILGVLDKKFAELNCKTGEIDVENTKSTRYLQWWWLR